MGFEIAENGDRFQMPLFGFFNLEKNFDELALTEILLDEKKDFVFGMVGSVVGIPDDFRSFLEPGQVKRRPFRRHAVEVWPFHINPNIGLEVDFESLLDCPVDATEFEVFLFHWTFSPFSNRQKRRRNALEVLY